MAKQVQDGGVGPGTGGAAATAPAAWPADGGAFGLQGTSVEKRRVRAGAGSFNRPKVLAWKKEYKGAKTWAAPEQTYNAPKKGSAPKQTSKAPKKGSAPKQTSNTIEKASVPKQTSNTPEKASPPHRTTPPEFIQDDKSEFPEGHVCKFGRFEYVC